MEDFKIIYLGSIGGCEATRIPSASIIDCNSAGSNRNWISVH
jgi:hypothetical protein